MGKQDNYKERGNMYRLEDEEEEEAPRRQQALNTKIDEALLQARRIFFCDAVDMDSAKDAIRKLWYLDIVNPGKPILLVINSPGGSVDAGFAIWDQVKMISSPVATLVTGLAASMGSVLSLCASPKLRFATPNARIMIHQPRIGGVIRGQATDLAIQAKEIIKTRTALVDLYTGATGRPRAEIEKAIDRDTWMSAEEAKNFGLLDKVVASFKDMP
jgi:ATP-dependent Clp protease protease subunit